MIFANYSLEETEAGARAIRGALTHHYELESHAVLG